MKFCAAKLMGGVATKPYATTITPPSGGVVKGNSKKNSLNYGRGGGNLIACTGNNAPYGALLL